MPARAQVGELNGRLRGKGITLELTDKALDYAVDQSYDHLYGARPLRRWLEKSILTDLSRMIVAGQLPDNSKVVADADANGLKYDVHKGRSRPGRMARRRAWKPSARAGRARWTTTPWTPRWRSRALTKGDISI